MVRGSKIPASTGRRKVWKEASRIALELSFLQILLEWRLKFDTPQKMKVDDNPFPGDQNMVDARLLKEKTKVLTLTKSREAGTVDPKIQISADEYREIRRRHAEQKSRYEQGETSKAEMTKSQVTYRIMLNKWQRQKKKDYQRWLEDQEYQRQLEEERYERKQAESHWNCPFFRYCWNEGLKLPTRHNCPECSNQYWEFRQSQINRWSIHAQDAYHHNNMDRHLKK